MARVFDNLKAGDRVTWKAINGEPTGIVEAVDGKGVMVRLPSGKQVRLSTSKQKKDGADR